MASPWYGFPNPERPFKFQSGTPYEKLQHSQLKEPTRSINQTHFANKLVLI